MSLYDYAEEMDRLLDDEYRQEQDSKALKEAAHTMPSTEPRFLPMPDIDVVMAEYMRGMTLDKARELKNKSEKLLGRGLWSTMADPEWREMTLDVLTQLHYGNVGALRMNGTGGPILDATGYLSGCLQSLEEFIGGASKPQAVSADQVRYALEAIGRAVLMIRDGLGDAIPPRQKAVIDEEIGRYVRILGKLR